MPKPPIQPCPAGAWDVMQFAHPATAEDFHVADDLDDRNGFIAVSSEFVPATLERIASALEGEEKAPLELRDIVERDGIERQLAAKTIMGLAKRAAANGALVAAAQPRDQVGSDQELALRKQGLQVVDRWFTRALKNRAGSIALKIVPSMTEHKARIAARKEGAEVPAFTPSPHRA